MASVRHPAWGAGTFCVPGVSSRNSRPRGVLVLFRRDARGRDSGGRKEEAAKRGVIRAKSLRRQNFFRTGGSMNGVSRWTFVLLAGLLPAAAWAQTTPAATSPPGGGYASISLDPSSSGVSAVNSAADLMKADGPDKAINFFTAVLNETKNASVRRMIQFQLVELYKQAGRPDQALEVLKDLIITTPPVANAQPQVIQIVPAADNSATQTPTSGQ